MNVPLETFREEGADGRINDLVRRAEAGEEVVLTRDGAPVARLDPIARPAGRKSPEEKLAAMEEIVAEVRRNPPDRWPSAARSQDFLYDGDGLPA